MKEKAKIDIQYTLPNPRRGVVPTYKMKDVVVDKPVAAGETGALVIHFDLSAPKGHDGHIVMSYLNGSLEFTAKALKLFGIDSRSVSNSKGYDVMTLSEVMSALQSKQARLAKAGRGIRAARQRGEVHRHLGWMNLLVSHKPMWLHLVADKAQVVVLHADKNTMELSSILCRASTSREIDQGVKTAKTPIATTSSADDLPLLQYGKSPILGAIKQVKMAKIAADMCAASPGLGELDGQQVKDVTGDLLADTHGELLGKGEAYAAMDVLYTDIFELFSFMERMFRNFESKTMELPPLKGLTDQHHNAAVRVFGWGYVRQIYSRVVHGGTIHIDDVIAVRAAIESHMAIRRLMREKASPL